MKSPPQIPAGHRVYAVGDIHGRLDLLEDLLARIIADAVPDTQNTLIFLGDYIDRGARSKEVVRLLSELELPGFEIVCLKGNHEDMLLDFIDCDDAPRAWGKTDGRFNTWLDNGGHETLISYDSDFTGDANMPDARCQLQKNMPARHLSFLKNLRICHIIGDYAFVHAGVRPGIAIEKQNEKDLMWIRTVFLESATDHGKMIVHGHSITDTPVVRKNRIGIDTGAWRSGILTSLVLEGDRRRFLST